MDSSLIEMFYALTVSHVKHFERFTPGAEIEPPIRHGAIDIENE